MEAVSPASLRGLFLATIFLVVPCALTGCDSHVSGSAGTASVMDGLVRKPSEEFSSKHSVNDVYSRILPSSSSSEWSITAERGGRAQVTAEGLLIQTDLDKGGDERNWWLESKTWSSSIRQANRGWTVETSLKVTHKSARENQDGVLSLLVGRGPYAIVTVGLKGVDFGNPSVVPMSTLVSLPQASSPRWVTLRVAQKPGSERFIVWVDGALVGSELEGLTGKQRFQLLIGDVTGSLSGRGYAKYLHWDLTGAFAPPTPSTKLN